MPRRPLPRPPLRSADPGPFDIIGDVHGCHEELVTLLERLGYRREGESLHHTGGRRAVFVGDLPNRGPANVAVLRTVAGMVRRGSALYTPGNHCLKLRRVLSGEKSDPKGATLTTLAELDALEPAERDTVVAEFLSLCEKAPPYLILDSGRLVVVHAGIEAGMIGKVSEEILRFVREGEVTGRTPEGRPIRRDWAAEYRGEALVVYGHTPQTGPRFVNNTVNVDQGCVYGGALTALRYPEREAVSVKALRPYWPRPIMNVAMGTADS